MSEYCFGLGPGHLPRKAATIARKHGATLVNHIDPGCLCGHGCADECPQCKRHWFAVEYLGHSRIEARVNAVMAALKAAGVKGTE